MTAPELPSSSPSPVRRVLDFLFKLPPVEKRKLPFPMALKKELFNEDSFDKNGLYVGVEFSFIMQLYCGFLAILAIILFFLQEDFFILSINFLDTHLISYTHKQKIAEHFFDFSRNVGLFLSVLSFYFVVRFFYNIRFKEFKIYFNQNTEDSERSRIKFQLFSIFNGIFLIAAMVFCSFGLSEFFVAVAKKFHAQNSYAFAFLNIIITTYMAGIAGFVLVVALSNIIAILSSFIFPQIIINWTQNSCKKGDK